MLTNTYTVCLSNQSQTVPFDPFNYEQADYPGFIEIDYLAGAFQTLERDSDIKGLTFYITWNVRELPTYGDDVVVVLMGDEWCHRPKYLGKAKAIFRQYGTEPIITSYTFKKLSYLNLLLILQFFRATLHGLPERLHNIYSRVFAKRPGVDFPTKQFVIPLGYANQLNLPVTSIACRPLDIYFAGSLNNQRPSPFSPKYWLQSPKNVARRRAIGSANHLKANRPELNIQLETTPEHVPSKLKNTSGYQSEAQRYSQRLMSAKICLVPRGSSPDTPRFFEALRYGCVAIADRLPSTWFYEGAPIVPIDNWEDLEQIVSDLLNNPAKLEQLHRDALNFWRTRCSEAVLGRFIAMELTVLNNSMAARGTDWNRDDGTGKSVSHE